MVPEPQTLSYWAQEIGGDMRTLARRVAGIKPARVEGRRKYYWLRDVVAAITADVQAKAEAAAPEQGGIEEWRKREQMARTRLLEADADEREGSLVGMDDIEWEWQTLVSATRARLLSIPHKLAPIVAAESDIGKCNAIIASEIHSALAELARGQDDVQPEGAGELQGAGGRDQKKLGPAAKANGERVGRRKPRSKS